ncbi:MAG TPA: hypothetical protein VKI65_07825 [Gemmataceae bacterium]|nr:hypothetical protein [Gemmataceae bacterium]
MNRASSTVPISWLLGPVTATVILHLAGMAIYVSRHGGDPSALVCVGQNRIGQPPYETISQSIGTVGYDGQFYYAIARNPWKQQVAGIDAPAARHLRLLYPAVCWFLSFGSPYLLIWVMPAVNLLAIGGLCGLGAWLAVRHGLNAWWGVTLPLAVTAGLPALRDLTDPLSTCAVAGLFVTWLAGWRGWVVLLWAAAAVFSREQNVAVVALLAGLSLWQRRIGLGAGIATVILVWCTWMGLLRLTYGTWPFVECPHTFDWPLAGLLSRWEEVVRTASLHGRGRFGNLWSLFSITLELTLAVGLLLTRKASGGLAVLLVAGGALAALAGGAIYVDYWSYMRVLVWLPMGIWLTAIATRRLQLLLFLAPQMLWSLLVITRV